MGLILLQSSASYLLIANRIQLNINQILVSFANHHDYEIENRIFRKKYLYYFLKFYDQFKSWLTAIIYEYR